jgi:lipopolysaccharide export system protein LptA
MMQIYRRFLPLAALLAAGLQTVSALAADAPAASAGAPAAPAKSGGALAGALSGKGKGPMQVTAEQGIEWQQTNRAYVARGNAVAKRGDVTLYADTLTAYYRDVPHSSTTEIWRVVADGHVRITTPTQSVVGDHGVYDLDHSLAIITGKGLKLTTPRDVVTARDSLEWYDDRQLAVARGDALAVHGDRRLRADVLAAKVVNQQGQPSRISRIDAVGHVLVSGPTQIGTGDQGVYDVDQQSATLSGHVTLTRGENTLVGEYGVVDFRNDVTRLLPRPPTPGNPTRGRVQGYLVPQQKPHTGTASGQKPVQTHPSQVPLQKSDQDPAKAR